MPVNRSLETALDLLIYFHTKLKHLHNSSSDKCPFLGDCEELRQMGSSKTNELAASGSSSGLQAKRKACLHLLLLG